eukprot:Skav207436  [mRNA]  locus=scaffold1798:306353:316621:+ [translate_table: standard]
MSVAGGSVRPPAPRGLDAGKSLWPQLQALLKRAKGGAPGDAVEFLQKFQEIVEVLPSSAWMSGKAELLLQELLEALATVRGCAFAVAAVETWKAYFAICRASGVPVESSCRWYPLALYLGQLGKLGTAAV